MKPQPKIKTPRDKKYLTFIRLQPCCVCNSPHCIEAHHSSGGGMGIKGSDLEAVPMCQYHHKDMDNRRKDDIPQLFQIIEQLQAAYTLKQ